MAKWRNRTTTQEAVRGPKPASTVRPPAEEAAIVLFRQQALLPLDDCLYALQEAILHLSRSALHRCFQRHGISRLPPGEEAAKAKKATFILKLAAIYAVRTGVECTTLQVLQGMSAFPLADDA